MAEVIEINDLKQLEQYRLAWNALLPQTLRASFFHTFDWLKTYWRHCGSEHQWRVLVVRSLGNTIGIVPLCVKSERHQLGRVRVLTYPLNDWGMWYGPIGPDISACLLMAMQHLQRTPRDWDMLDLRWSSKDTGQNNATELAFRAADWSAEKSDYQQTSIVQLEGTGWETYHTGLSKKWRQELGRMRRGLERDFHVEFERHRPLGGWDSDSEPRWDLYAACRAIAKQSWQGKSTTGNTLTHPCVSDFLQASHEVAARLGMLDMIVMKLNGTPAAFQYNYHYDGRLCGLRMGYAPGFAKRGVGRVLLAWMIEDSFARGDRVIDLGIGEYDFKRRLRTAVETNQRFTYYPWQAWRGQSVRLSRWVKSRWPSAREESVSIGKK